MRKSKLFSFILAICCSLSIMALAVTAEDAAYFGEGDVSGELDKSLIFAGSSISTTANVNGAIISAGLKLEAGGVGEYAFLAGNSIAISGSIKNDAFIAGNQLTVSGNVGRDIFSAGKTLYINGNVGRNLYATGDTIIISGRIGGDVVLSASKITVAADAVIAGTLKYNSDATVNIGAADIKTDVYAVEKATVDEDISTTVSTVGTVGKIVENVVGFAGLCALAFVLLFLTPLYETIDAKYTGKPFGKYASAFGIGFAVLIGLPIASVILMITQVGLRLAFLILVLWIAAMIASPIFLAFFLGSLIWRRLFKKATCYPAELPIGLLALTLLELIPVANFFVGLVTIPFGMGVAVLLLGKGKKKTEATVQVSAENGSAN